MYKQILRAILRLTLNKNFVIEFPEVMQLYNKHFAYNIHCYYLTCVYHDVAATPAILLLYTYGSYLSFLFWRTPLN